MAEQQGAAAPSEREQFEAYMRSLSPTVRLARQREALGGYYRTLTVQRAWNLWQAARRAQPAPPAVVEPMTDEQITEIWAAKVRYHAAPIGSTDLEFARDIERAHGIKKGAQDGTL